MKKEKRFPVEIQRWIVGQRVADDGVSLSSCGVSSDGHTIFCYLMSCKPKAVHPGLEGKVIVKGQGTFRNWEMARSIQ